MEKYICIHGHFYQPPRENPWLEAIEIQDSAYPYHNWNERITAECYAPNSAARILDDKRHIQSIVNNYAKMSFNFGPTLLAWMEVTEQEVYQAILEADRMSILSRSGHGNAIAQVYNHMIMPLANRHDKYTQIMWGIKDFEYRFKRFPEGMWLAETAVDYETLDIMAELGIRFVILSPYQASRVKKPVGGKWSDVKSGQIDPTRPYLCKLPSGRTMSVFFYDGPISNAVAFEGLLDKGEDFANRLMGGFSDNRTWPQIVNIATDGETYGHHHRFGEMALAYALNYIERNKLAQLTNYGEYLEKYPSSYDVQIIENTSWSCAHGIERWRSDCGCNSGANPRWNQKWRKPLRETYDWLRDTVVPIFEDAGGRYFNDPWKARNGYIHVILDRSAGSIDHFLNDYGKGDFDEDDRRTVLCLLEMERHAMLMYTSCGWFFDDISGIETIQTIQYAGRVVQLAEYISGKDIEDKFLLKIGDAKSNIPEFQDGANIYRRFVKPSIIGLEQVGAHYAISSLFEDYGDETDIYSYKIRRLDYNDMSVGLSKMATGMINVCSNITYNAKDVAFSVLYLGGHALSAFVGDSTDAETYQARKGKLETLYQGGDFANMLRAMESSFDGQSYSLVNLFKDEQRKILRLLIGKNMEEFESSYRHLYEENRVLMGFLQDTGMPVPGVFMSAAKITLTFDLYNAFGEETIDPNRVKHILHDMQQWGISIDPQDMEYMVKQKLSRIFSRFYNNPQDIALLEDIENTLEITALLPVDVNRWQAQNIYYKIASGLYGQFMMKAVSGDDEGKRWVEAFKKVGEMLYFNVTSILPG